MQPDFHDPDVPAPEVGPPIQENSEPGPDAWREEVAARLARYRTRRKPRAPRYPSLLLPFEPASTRSRDYAAESQVPAAKTEQGDCWTGDNGCDRAPDVEKAGEAEDKPVSRAVLGDPPPYRAEEGAESFANVIEFPRSAAIPLFHGSALADPIVERPRIVEAPEIVPPPPALGGILIESPLPEAPDRMRGSESNLAAASIPRRFLAAALDVLILIAALSASGALFLRLNPIHAPLASVAAISVALLAMLWMAYQFTFIVFTGSTPGLRAARLRIAKFDGSGVARRTRRWRVFASFLSAFAAGLGYLWCFLDQDSLCWHDRITRTLIQPMADQSKGCAK